MAEKETFETWLKLQGFTDNTVSKLIKEEFTNSSELASLNKWDIETLNLKLAQRKLLERVISRLQKEAKSPETTTAPVTTKDLAHNEEFNKLLHLPESLSIIPIYYVFI